jgi:hypothetical protein
MIVVKESNIKHAGLGVFAHKNIKKGQVICFYDGEDVPMNDDAFDPYTMAHPTLRGVCRKGFNKPRINKGVGQFINDGAMLNWNDDDITGLLTEDKLGVKQDAIQLLKKKYNQYQTATDSKKNAAFIDDKFNITTTTNVKKNEEVYFTYGPGYWIDRLQKQSSNPYTKMFIDVYFGSLAIRENNDKECILHFHNIRGKYDEECDSLFQKYYRLDNNINFSHLVKLYQTVVQKLKA